MTLGSVLMSLLDDIFDSFKRLSHFHFDKPSKRDLFPSGESWAGVIRNIVTWKEGAQSAIRSFLHGVHLAHFAIKNEMR